MTKRITKDQLIAENHNLRQLLAREMADRAAVQDKLNVMLANKARAVVDDYMSFAAASDYARHYGGVVRRVAETGRFTVIPKGVRA